MKAHAANPFDLTRRVAVVTDGGSPTGIGTATASMLAGLRGHSAWSTQPCTGGAASTSW